MKKITCLLLLLVTSLIVNAQNFTYIGGGPDNNWTTDANWQGGISPGLTINPGMSINIQSGKLVTSSSGIDNYGTINNYGTMEISSITDTGGFYNHGTITTFGLFCYSSSYNFGTITTNGYSVLQGEIINNGIIESNADLTNYGNLYNNNTFINNSEYYEELDGILSNTGELKGTNIYHYDKLLNGGSFSPGNPIGTYTINGFLFHNNSSSLNIELETTTSYDKVNVYGAATLNGTLDVTLLNGFTPSLGDTFTILTADTVSGSFATTNLPAGYVWSVSYTPTAVILEVTSTLSTLDAEISGFSMYPNPVKEELTIQLNAASTLEKVSIYNMLGQEVLTSKVANINTTNLASGTYIVEVVTNTGKATKRLIKD